MSTRQSELVPIECLAGVQPAADSTPLDTKHWTFSSKIRFKNERYEKIGGWVSNPFDSEANCYGAARSLFSSTINGVVQTIIGTHKYLYGLRGSRLTNISPFIPVDIPIANSLATLYGTLANNPIATENGSNIVTISDAEASRFVAGDIITISGASGVGGVLAGALNSQHRIRSVSSGSYTINVSSPATSTATGGGASVVRSCGIINVTDSAHGQSNGDRVKISGAVDIGGILAAQINLEFIIRNVAPNTFDIYTAGTSSSSVSSGGGASTVYREQLAEGNRDESTGQGYGMGLYGMGLYGVAKLSVNKKRYPRIWHSARFGEKILMTPSNQGALYEWDADTSEAPIIVSGAPAAINYMFVSDNICVTFGAGNVENKIFSSDQNDYTEWVSSSTNLVFEDNVEGAGRLISHAPVGEANLIFTENQTYTMRFIGSPLVWEIKLKDPTIGIIGSMARVSVGDTAYWMGNRNFYMCDGSNIRVIPSNSQPNSTILEHVFTNINMAQKSKIFAWYNQQYNEVWWHYPSAGSLDCDSVARLCLDDFTWCPDTFDRSAAEFPNAASQNHRLMKTGIGDVCTLYKHEFGTDDDGQPMLWSITSNYRTVSKDTTTTVAIVPDSIQDGSIDVNISGYLWPQSTAQAYTQNYAVTSDQERIPVLSNSRFWQYRVSGNTIGQRFVEGKWQEEIQRGGSSK